MTLKIIILNSNILYEVAGKLITQFSEIEVSDRYIEDSFRRFLINTVRHEIDETGLR